jgi:hypothetical protein
MAASRASAMFAIAAAVAGSVLAAVVAAPIAHADSLQNVIDAVNKDRAAAHCPQLTYNPVLQQAAEAYANSENTADSRPGNYNGQVFPYLGSGDPQAAAINSAYRSGAGATLSLCKYTEFGVGFVRHEDRSVDVVTIVFGIPGPPPTNNAPVNIGSPVLAPDDPPAVVNPPPAHVTTPVVPPPAAVPTATVTSDVDLYDKPNVPDGAGKKIEILRTGTVVKVAAPCPSDDWCLLLDPAGAAYGSFFRNN